MALGFGVLAGLAALAWALIFWKVREPQAAHADTATHATPESLGQTVRGFGALFLLPHGGHLAAGADDLCLHPCRCAACGSGLC